MWIDHHHFSWGMSLSWLIFFYDLSSGLRRVSGPRKWAAKASARWKSRHKWPRSWDRSKLLRLRNRLRSQCEFTKNTNIVSVKLLSHPGHLKQRQLECGKLTVNVMARPWKIQVWWWNSVYTGCRGPEGDGGLVGKKMITIRESRILTVFLMKE